MYGSNMFNTNLKNILDLPRTLNGISKALKVVNQAIPLYKQAKPMISNGKKLLNMATSFSNNKNKTIKENKSTHINQPQFFQ